jgi:coproporphyrinogen III oxidase-like Fe-S oxidoreductase
MITDKTEWAIESTGSLLSDCQLSKLKEWRFGRLHVSVQSLNDSIRKSIGRKLNAEEVLRRTAKAINLGFITSVDIIYGLPEQDLRGLIDDLYRLTGIGNHGISLYRLNASVRNEKFIDRHRQQLPDDIYTYVLFQAADQYLSSLDYMKNHFAHFAFPKDRNLYYTHPKRGKDLLALGASADGYFQGYIYRNNIYPKYLEESIEGGLAETSRERKIRPLVSALMCGLIGESFKSVLDNHLILDRWIESKLIDRFSKDKFKLTANGSLFISEMIKEARMTMLI